MNTEQQYDTIVSAIHHSSRKIQKAPKKKTKILSVGSLNILDKRSSLEKGSDEYRKVDKEVKRSIRKDIRQYNCRLVQIALENNKSLRIAKQGVSRCKSWINCLKDENGKNNNDRDQIMKICTDFYKNLYTDNTTTTDVPNYSLPDTIPLITEAEVLKALKKMKYNKSTGTDNVTTETLRIGAPALLPHITSLFNSIFKTGKIPSQMCHSNIILLHKKGEKSDIGNYRPISLLSHMYKLFIRIILNRIDGDLDSHQPPEQAGFRRGFSTTDHLQVVNQAIEKCNEFNKYLYIAFVDYKKAFDSVKHSAVFQALNNQNIEDTYINLLKLIYSNSTADIKLQSSGPSFHITKGVKQGDPLSPKLFTSTLEEIFKTLAEPWAERGVIVNDKRLTNLRFADDIVLFSTSASELQDMLQDLSRASLKVGLAMNRSKTQIMTNSTKHRVVVDGREIHYVDEYTYLGQIVSFEGRQDREIERRKENAWKSFWSMKELMKGDLPIALKRKLVDMCILPILTYGAQTWSLTKDQKSSLRVCQRAMERSILGVKRIDRIRNTTLRAKTGITDVGAKAAKLKWDWAGHVGRMHPDRWAKIVTQWVPEDGRRSRKRPRKRWRDDLDKFDGDWPSLAQDRNAWKNVKETFALQWDTIG